MRGASLFAAALLATACKDGAGATGPGAGGTLNVQIEARTCSAQGAFDVEVFIDHMLVGTPKLMVGSVASYPVTAGSHTVGGFAVDGRFNWGSVAVEVPAGGQYTASFGCQ